MTGRIDDHRITRSTTKDVIICQTGRRYRLGVDQPPRVASLLMCLKWLEYDLILIDLICHVTKVHTTYSLRLINYGYLLMRQVATAPPG